VTIVGQRSYSVGFTLPDTIVDALAKDPEREWQPAYDAGGEPRPGAWVLEATGLLDLSRWPKGMRVIVRKERPVRREALLIRTEVRGLRRRSCRSRTVELRAA
jgi:hypothetical protein